MGSSAGGDDGRADAWLAEERVDQAARQRSRTAALARQAAEEAALASLLVTMSERGDHAVVHLRSGRVVQGPVYWVGLDGALLVTSTGPLVLVSTAAICRLFATGAVGPPVSGRAPSGPDRRTILAGIAGDGVRVQVPVGPGSSTAGDLDHVGVDFVAVRQPDRTVAYLPLVNLDELTLLDHPWAGGTTT